MTHTKLNNNPEGAGRVIRLEDLGVPRAWRVAVLAPHPDDFDAIGVTMRHLFRNGNALEVAVMTTGQRGVPQGFAGADTPAKRRDVREAEQLASIALFGLPARQLTFLRLDERGPGEDVARVRSFLAAARPDVVFLPHGNDANAAHRRTHELLTHVVRAAGWRLHAFLARDPKTIAMRTDLLTVFGPDEAAWKAALLRCHRSQHERNLQVRGTGIDDRVLEMNRRVATQAGLDGAYAEAFELVELA